MGPLFLILWLICGVLCFFITKNKGYPDNECYGNAVGGFLGGIIWLIVVLCKKPYSGYNSGISTNNNQPRAVNNDYQVPVQPTQAKIESWVEKEGCCDITQQVALEAIEKLAALKSKGILTDEEFMQKKAELLTKI